MEGLLSTGPTPSSFLFMVMVILSASVKRFYVSRMQDFSFPCFFCDNPLLDTRTFHVHGYYHCILSYYVSFQWSNILKSLTHGIMTGLYFKSDFKKLIFCSAVSASTGYREMTSLTVEQFLCLWYESWRSPQTFIYLVSNWVYVKHCQGTFKRMKSHLANLQILFCSTHNFVGELWHRRM